MELTTGAKDSGAVLCLVTGEVFEHAPFEKPAKVGRQRPKKGQPQRIRWQQNNFFAPLLVLGGGFPDEEQRTAAGRRHQVHLSMRPNI